MDKVCNLILINCLGVQDSGGITVFETLLNEIKNIDYKFYIICDRNDNIEKLVKKYNDVKNFEFLLIHSKGFLHRLYFENIVFRKLIKDKNIELVYNFSGSAQFFSKIPQITKVHNLLFYSKKIDEIYWQKKQYISWLKQIFLKRIIFHSMFNQSQYIEVQSNHVKDYIKDFINIPKKQLFIKSDVKIDSKLFKKAKEYDFTTKLRFLYIVGPHFEYMHKNFDDFVKTMIELKKNKFSFEIIVTLTKEELYNSGLWDKCLDAQTNFLGYVSKNDIEKQFQDNTILISTSVIETIGLHVIEAVRNGILAIVPREKYCITVYGEDIVTYELFNRQSMVETIKKVVLLNNNEINDKILQNQQYLIKNEKTKHQNIIEIFDQIIKDKDVSK